MRSFIWLSVVALLAGAGTSFAKPPTIGECPAEVAADVPGAIATRCPCDGPGEAWKNHGKYVSCIVRYRNELRKLGCLDAEAKRTIARCAARSTCGKEGAVLCCTYDTSATCSDPTHDGTAAGVCSNDATKACDTATDCVVATGPPRVTRHEETCTARGGTAVGGGSVCSPCPLPTPVPPPPPAP